LSRQAYYKSKSADRKRETECQQVGQLVSEIRQLLPRVGGRKLYKMIQSELNTKGIKMGRDLFFNYLRSTDQLVRPRKKYVVTTQSSHRFRVYNNLLEGHLLTGSHQAWVSDITYLRTYKGFCYLALITDGWSRKIVGYDISNSMELSGCLRALHMALKQLPISYELIHHSDRGIQYCSNVYTDKLKTYKIKISMAEKGNCYQNAMAERVNGILKSEFYLDAKFNDIVHAKKSAIQAIQLYNDYRPHLKLNYQTPEQIHL